jgi:hypothetical protein
MLTYADVCWQEEAVVGGGVAGGAVVNSRETEASLALGGLSDVGGACASTGGATAATGMYRDAWMRVKRGILIRMHAKKKGGAA